MIRVRPAAPHSGSQLLVAHHQVDQPAVLRTGDIELAQSARFTRPDRAFRRRPSACQVLGHASSVRPGVAARQGRLSPMIRTSAGRSDADKCDVTPDQRWMAPGQRARYVRHRARSTARWAARSRRVRASRRMSARDWWDNCTWK